MNMLLISSIYLNIVFLLTVYLRLELLSLCTQCIRLCSFTCYFKLFSIEVSIMACTILGEVEAEKFGGGMYS